MNALTGVPYSPPLVAVAILEKDTNFDIEWVWYVLRGLRAAPLARIG